MKEALIYFLLFVLLFALVPLAKPESVLGDVEIRGVAVSPSGIGSVSQYTIYVVLHKDLGRGEKICIKFPEECTVPQTINKDHIEIGGKKPSLVEANRNIVSLTLSEPILKYEGAATGGVSIFFSSSIGIKNPSNPDMYSIEMWTTSEPNPVYYSFYVGDVAEGSSVKDLTVIVVESGAGENSEYDISFRVTFEGALIPGDYIDVFFPKGTVLPTNPDPGEVLINLSNTSSVSVQGRRVRMYVPKDRVIMDGAQCSVIFTKRFGIVNPDFTGTFAIQVSTSKDTGFATSNLYTLYGTPVEAFSVTANPSSQKSNAEYRVEFRTSNDSETLEKDVDRINIRFAYSFSIPSFVKPGAITVNGIPCVNVQVEESTIRISVPLDINPYTKVTVLIKQEFGILNPESTGNHEVFINTSSDAVYVGVSLSITPSTISGLSVVLSNTAAGQLTAYDVTFTTGVNGNLLPGIDRVNVVFPVGTTIPSVVTASAVLVNGIPTSLLEISGTTFAITVPVEVKAKGQVMISIKEAAGLRNPVNSGDYCLYVFTSKETTSMKSNSYAIRGVPQTSLRIDPAQPDGLNGFYRSKPLVSFSSTSAIDPSPVIYYYFDSNAPSVYSSPILCPEGLHTLFYYAVDKEGHREELRSIQIKVDTIPPQIVLIAPEDGAVLNQRSVVVTGKVDAGSTVKINGVAAQVDGLGNFSLGIELADSPQTVNITAIDEAGNSSQKTITFSLDTTPPPLSISKPVMFQQISKLPILVEGVTEKGATVTVNGGAAIVNEEGKFSFSIDSAPESTLFNIEIIAKDRAGNTAKKTVTVRYSKSVTMMLQVGNAFALVNGQTYTLEAAPIISSGRTMVPLRFVGEAFGAEFSYEASSKTIDITFRSDKITMQIGKKTAVVNGKEVALDVAPFIVNGRTLVPIRFISETFGAEVIWESTTKTVTIAYPKL